MLDTDAPKEGRRAARNRRDTREAILNCAEQLLQRCGYSGFAYQQIGAQLGIRNAAIHYHFPAKADLGIALVQRYRARFAAWGAALSPALDGAARLRAYFALYAEHLEADGCRLCPGGALAAEFGTLPDAIRLEVRLLMREMHTWLTQTLEQGRRDRTLDFGGDVDGKAVQVGAALQGGLQIARLAGPERFHQLLEQLSLELSPQRTAAGG